MKSAIKIILLCAFYFFTTSTGYAQNEVQAAIDSMKRSLVTAKHDSNRIKTIFRISDRYEGVNTDSALAYIQVGLAQSKKMGWKKGIAVFYNSLGNVNNDNSNFDKAIYYYKLSSIINRSIGNLHNLASNLVNIASVYQKHGDAAKSLPYTFEALKVAEKIAAYDLISACYSNAANISLVQKDYKKALSYGYKARKNYRLANDKNGEANMYNTIGNIYFEQKKFKDADTYYNTALPIYKTTGYLLGEATTLSHLALIYESDKDKKLEYLLSAQKLFDEINPKYVVSIANLGNIGGTYADVFVYNRIDNSKTYKNIPKDYTKVANKAKYYLNMAISYSKEIGDNENLSYFSDNLSQLQAKMGDYKSALYNYQRSRGIDDSLYSQASKNKIADLIAQNNFQKKEDAYKQRQQISELKVKQIFLYAALIILLAGSVLVYLLNRSRISQLRLRNELQQKEAEEQTRELLHRNKLSESELKAIRAQMNPHFIFNVLNSIESYILENDSKTASRLVQKFASLSRIILENSTQSMVTAEREWKALKLYTELEAMRFNNQFTYSFYVDPLIDLSALMLPPMLVQPLIENSIHHGLRNSPNAENAVNIKLEQTDRQVYFTVEDNGIGIDEAQKFKNFTSIKSKSIGLSAIRERIEIINVMNEDKRAEFKIHKKNKDEGSGTIAILTLPKTSRS
jgi:tetratricopeptide (TPR) repeat protein/signal transduction histidine kinase